jgi:hypothetical protein|tara:strand:+ start:2178 stop:2555 length:378 start_codon:yes stop_codon:yes gene_type:complete
VRLKAIGLFTLSLLRTTIALPCKSIVCAVVLVPIVRDCKGGMLVVARTIAKNPALVAGGVANVILFSTILNAVIGSCITPLKDTSNEYGLPGKNPSPPRVSGKVTLLPLKSGFILSSLIKELDDC